MSQRVRAGAVVVIAGLSTCWLAFSLLVWAFGESPHAVARSLLEGTWGMPYGIGQVLYKATPLLLTGVAVDLALRAGLFNVGAEGQLAIAGLAVATVGAHLPPATPSAFALPAVFAVAAAAGATWAWLPAALRARFGAHEVISTIMMNRIVDAAIGLALARGLALPGTTRTPDILSAARLPRLEALGIAALHGSAVSLALPASLVVTAIASVWLAKTRVGREVVLVGLSPAACAAEGIPVARRLGAALVLSGAIAGLASIGPVIGYKGYYESGLGSGAGFGGIAVALLGRGSPIGMPLAAMVLGTLDQGGLVVNGRVPMEIMTILQGVIIVAVALADARTRHAVARAGA